MGQQKSSLMMALRDERMLARVIIAGICIDSLLVLFVLFLDASLGLLSSILCCVGRRLD